MQKKKISPERAKFISTFLVAFIFMIFVFSIAKTFTAKMLQSARSEYFFSLRTSLDVLSRIIEIQLDDYKRSLDSFFYDKNVRDADINQIIAFMKEDDYKKHEDFLDLYFLMPDGTAYFSDGETIKMSVEKHSSLTPGNDCFISGLCIPPGTDTKLFCIERTLYAEDGTVVGAMGVGVKIDAFMDRISSIRVGSKEVFMIIDKTGTFLVHPRKEIIGRVYTPDDKKYASASSNNLAKSPPVTIVAKADDESLVYISTSKVRGTNWTVALRVALSDFENVFEPQKRMEIIVLVFSIVVIFALVFVETKVMNIFQRKQLIATVYDPLTNLWTRERFEKEAAKFIKSNPHSKFLLIEADIRGFKFINQNYGEEEADKLILFYSRMLNKYASFYHSIIGRGFADHFYVFIRISTVRKAMTVFKKNLVAFEKDLKAYEIPFFPKFGLAFLMPDGKSKGATIQTLIGQATFAKSTIKDIVVSPYEVYNARLLGKVLEESYIENNMQKALDNHEFFIMYQPKISLLDDKIVGAEALVRWNTSDQGVLTPDKFIPLFERNGFIKKLDYYVYEEVFKFIHKQLESKQPVVPVSVNMSRNHDKPEKFMHDFIEIFKKYSIPPSMVQVEIIERSVMDNSTLQNVTNMLHKEGFSVAMDDFGSGESSLNMLTKIPVDVLKFDREFLSSFTDSNGKIDSKSAKFIHILIDLSKHLNKQTVFEGVETEAQRDFLRSIRCDQVQGYFYSKPLTEKDFVDFIQNNI